MDPPMKLKSITASTTGFPSIRPRPVITASLRPVFRRAASSRPGYGLRSENVRGSPLVMPPSFSSKEPESMSNST